MAATLSNNDDLSGERFLDNKENIGIIWYDFKMGTHRSADKHKCRLREINDYVRFFTVRDECVTYIGSVRYERILLITSGKCASEILPLVAHLKQIDSIFIFCFHKCEYEDLKTRFPKIVNVFADFDLLCQSISDAVGDVNRQLQEYAFLNSHQQSMRNLSEHSPAFHWFQLTKSVIMRLPQSERSKTEMLEACRQYYRNNLKEIERINDFDKNYKSDQVIRWYTRQSFVYKLVNKALRCEDIDQLLRFRFFIVELSTRLSNEHKKMLEKVSDTLTVYRGVKLTKEELEKFQRNIGQIMATNGFWSTSRDYQRALLFARKPSKRDGDNVISVLFEITCDIQGSGRKSIFADIAEHSEHPREREVLFDLSTCFRIDSVSFQKDKQVWLIEVSIAAAGENTIKACFPEENINNELLVGILLCDVGHYKSAQKYLETLLRNPGTEDIALILLNIGRALYYQGKLVQARNYYDKAYDLMKKARAPSKLNIASLLNNIGVLLRDQRKYVQAEEYYQKALQIQKELLAPNDISIAHTLTNIGNVLHEQGKYDKALEYHTMVLKRYEQARMMKHLGYATTLNNIGNVLFSQGKYKESQQAHRKALDIRQSLLPPEHPDIADSFNNLANVLFKQGNYEDALDLHQKTRIIREQCLPVEHPKIAEVLSNIGTVFQIQKKYENAFQYYKRALTIQEKCLPPIHSDIAFSLNNIGLILNKQQNYAEALEYCKRALAIQEKCQEKNHPSLALCYHSIGEVLTSQGNYDEAMEHVERALEIQSQSLPENHFDIARSLHSIGCIRQKQQRYDESLKLYRRSLAMKEKCLSENHPSTASTLCSIGHVLKLKENYTEAIKYFERAHVIRMKYLSEYDSDIADGYYQIGLVYEKLKQPANAFINLRRAADIYLKLPDNEKRRNDIEHHLQRLNVK